MWALVVPVVGQHLSEEDIVVRPDGIEVHFVFFVSIFALIGRFWYRTVSIAIVTISIAIFYVTAIVNNAVFRQIDVLNTRRTVGGILLDIILSLRD